MMYYFILPKISFGFAAKDCLHVERHQPGEQREQEGQEGSCREALYISNSNGFYMFFLKLLL